MSAREGFRIGQKRSYRSRFSKLNSLWLIYHIQDFWLYLLNGYDIYFWLRDTANQP